MATKTRILALNTSTTLVFIPFFCWRVIHRIRHGVPAAHDSLSGSNAAISKKRAWANVYIGVDFVDFWGFNADRELSIFDLLSMPQLIHDPQLLETFKYLHTGASRILAACIVLHVLALLKHEITGKRILARML